jgi:hypothetical protein
MTRAFALSLAAAAALAVPAPAFAQETVGPEEKYNQIIVYGDDPCPQSTEAEITVCARLGEGERFRIPTILRDSASPANTAWTERVRSFETVGDFGIKSCTPVGPGGALGCTEKLIDQAYAERRTSSDVQMSQLIEEERAKRLSTIDEEAAETQARVEQIEKEYMERLEREQAAVENAAANSAADAEPLPHPTP